MSDSFVLESAEFEPVATLEEIHPLLSSDTPFRILIVGDLGGESRPARNSSAATIREIDRDNLERSIEKLRVAVRFSPGEANPSELTIRFAEMEDFHPDRIFDQLPIFEYLRRTRKNLHDPKQFDAAAADVRKWIGSAEQRDQSAEMSRSAVADAPPSDSAMLIEQMLGGAGVEQPAIAKSRPSDELDSFINSLVRPHLLPKADPQADDLVEAVDELTGELMRSILHDKRFQEIEGAWRALNFLVSNLDTGVDLKLFVMDISKEELRADLAAANGKGSSVFYQVLVEETVGTLGGDPWALVVGNFEFDKTREDAELLSTIGKVAARAGAPFVGGANPRVFGCNSLAESTEPREWTFEPDAETGRAWNQLSVQAHAASVGLVAPRFALRVPYGDKSDEIERFEFEEMPGGSQHEDYLWGNGAFLCCYLLAEGFSRYGWDLSDSVPHELDNLPMHVYEQAGESRIKPCAEVLLSERAAEAILDSGVMPLLSYRDTDRVRLMRIQSISKPPKALAGRWN